MKKLLTLSLIALLMLSTASFAAKKPASNPAPSASAVEPANSGLVISPKLALGTSGLNALALGCEVAKSIMPQVSAMGEVEYYAVSGASVMQIAGNGVYTFAPVPGAPGTFYAGGGLLYQMISNVNVSAIGFQTFGGMDYPIAGVGTVFGQAKYVIANYTTPGVTVGGFSFPGVSVSSGGFVLEGGYRFYL